MFIRNGVEFNTGVTQVIGVNQYPAGYFDTAERRAAFSVIEIDGNPPITEAFHDAIRGSIALVNGSWVQQWTIVPWSDARIAAAKTGDIASVWELIKVERDRRLNTGGYLALGHWYNSDVRAKGEQSDLAIQADKIALAGGDMAAQYVTDGIPVSWKTMDGVYVPMNGNLAIAIRDAARSQTVKTYKAAATHQYYLGLSANPGAYDFSAGWPPIYGEI